LSGFAVERTLTVSHFRLGLLKRLIPLKLLVWMDSLAQFSGNFWQLTPSVFVLARAVSPTASVEQSPPAEGAFFQCPACGSALADTPPELTCASCGRVYPVKDGIYDFRLNP